MKALLNILFTIIHTCILSIWRFIRDKVVPVINFMQGIKKLAAGELTAADFNAIIFFRDFLGCQEEWIKAVITAFIESLKELVPHLEIFKSKKPSNDNIILAFVEYYKSLEKAQRSMLLCKLASLVIFNNEKDTKHNHSDFIVQLTYSWMKNKEKLKN